MSVAGESSNSFRSLDMIFKCLEQKHRPCCCVRFWFI